MHMDRIQLGLKDVLYVATIAVSIALAWSAAKSENALALEEIKQNYVPRAEYNVLIDITRDIQQRVSRIEGKLER